MGFKLFVAVLAVASLPGVCATTELIFSRETRNQTFFSGFVTDETDPKILTCVIDTVNETATECKEVTLLTKEYRYMVLERVHHGGI